MTGKGPAPGLDGPAGRRRWADLGPRVGSAAVLIVATAAALWIGGLVFALFVGAVFAGAYREWDMMVSGRRLTRSGLLLTGLVALTAVAHAMAGVLAAALVLAAACGVALASSAAKRGWRLAGLVIASLVIAAILQLRGTGAEGLWACGFLAAVIWGTDTGAFFAGRLLGGAKLSPGISPGKTWSGALGGLAVGTLGGLLVWSFATASPWWIGVLLAAATSVIGQFGDLGESAAKRRFGIKDSGDSIPGHGGLMDRLDSLTPGAVFVALVGVLNGEIGAVAQGFLNW